MSDWYTSRADEAHDEPPPPRPRTVRGIVSAATRGIVRHGRKYRVRVWIPGKGYKHIGLYPTLDQAILVHRRKRKELVDDVKAKEKEGPAPSRQGAKNT